MGYLPRVLFFNAFELGAERWKSSIIKWGIGINGCLTSSSLTFALNFRKHMIIARWRDESYGAFSHIYNGAQEL
jgi:hypothetical protein